MKIKTLFLSILIATAAMSQEKIKLYPNGATESNELASAERLSDPEFLIDISEARMLAFPADKAKANGAAVLICPGGGYRGVSHIKEGEEIAHWFNEMGISAFVLYYRMPNGHHTIPLKDAQTAFSIIRSRSKEWNIKKNNIGIMGFSAGGHLASTLGTHFKTKAERPAFMLLGYPVVTMDSTYTHKGSRNNLLGKTPTDELVKLYSNELQVTKKTPPTFIVHAKDDGAVPIANSENLKNALDVYKVPVNFVVYDKGGHGFGMRKRNIPADNWPEELRSWMKEMGII